MQECTQNILASIEAGSTTIEGWQEFVDRMGQQDASDIDPYHYESYCGAREALSLLAQQQAQEG